MLEPFVPDSPLNPPKIKTTKYKGKDYYPLFSFRKPIRTRDSVIWDFYPIKFLLFGPIIREPDLNQIDPVAIYSDKAPIEHSDSFKSIDIATPVYIYAQLF